MLRQRLNEALKDAMKRREDLEVSTLRLILAAIKDRDIAARGQGNAEGIGEDQLLQLLQTMIKQRMESIALYEQGGRLELAQQEADEINVIRKFLPEQLDDLEIAAAVRTVIEETAAASLKDMGPTMAELRKRYAGRMDFAKASGIVKQHLS